MSLAEPSLPASTHGAKFGEQNRRFSVKGLVAGPSLVGGVGAATTEGPFPTWGDSPVPGMRLRKGESMSGHRDADEREPAFKVIDRRRFSPDGSERAESEEVHGAAPVAAPAPAAAAGPGFGGRSGSGPGFGGRLRPRLRPRLRRSLRPRLRRSLPTRC